MDGSFDPAVLGGGPARYAVLIERERVGGTCLGPRATDLIAEGAPAVETEPNAALGFRDATLHVRSR